MSYQETQYESIMTEKEFAEVAGNAEAAAEIYPILFKMVQDQKLSASDLKLYARFGWCLQNPEAVVAYQTGSDKWEVNNCAAEITEQDAKIRINAEWGFEASRIKIIGIPYFEAWDWQFIRFDCAGMTWLWKDSTLYQVYV